MAQNRKSRRLGSLQREMKRKNSEPRQNRFAKNFRNLRKQS